MSADTEYLDSVESLSQRELEVLRSLHDGLSNAEIAQRLVLSVHTVKWYTRQIYGKFGVNKRTAALARARQLGLVGASEQTAVAWTPLAEKKSTLPPQPSAFVGRETEIAELTRLLTKPDCRLLTLVGPGGIGKTRLALELAARQLDCFPHGAHFIPLQSVDSPDQIATAIVAVLQIPFPDSGEHGKALQEFLRNRTVLLVIDNVEHLLDGIGILSDILQSAPGAKIIATSRETLQLQEEWQYLVPAMTVPTSESAERLESYSAVQLFTASALRKRTNFSLEDEYGSVAQICRLVAGMPLAIELAAAWVPTLSCDEIAAEIERSFDILETSTRNVEPRHRSMRAALDHSWNLLTDAERDALRKLAIFHGGFTQAAAVQVAGAPLRMLSSLLNKSLLWHDGAGRYDMHELVRQYAEARLTESPDLFLQTQAKHIAYYTAFVERDRPLLTSRRRSEAAETFESELDNVRAAWRRAIATHDIASLGRCGPGLSSFCWFRGRWQEGFELFKAAIDMVRAERLQYEAGADYARLLTLQAEFCLARSDFDTATALADEGLEFAKAAESVDDIMLALGTTATIECLLDHHDEHHRVMREGLAIARATGNRFFEAAFMRCESDAILFMTTTTEAEAAPLVEAATRRLAIALEIDNPGLIFDTSAILGRAAQLCHKYVEAARYFSEMLALASELNDLSMISLTNGSLARLAVAQNDFADARRWYRRELDLGIDVGSRVWQIDAILGIAPMFAAEGQPSRAAELAAMVEQFPAAMTIARNTAAQLLADFQSNLAPEEYARAVETGRSLDLDATLRELLVEFDREPTVNSVQ